MSLSEVELFFFFPVVFAVYWLLPRRAVVQNVVLTTASLFFYATWNAKLLPLFLLSTLVDFAVLRAFARTPAAADDAPEDERAKRTATRRRWLILSLVSNLVVLAGFKYVGAFNKLLALGLPPIALPLGISFYTMSRLGVVIDTYYDRIPPVRSLLVWVTFTSFFPQLIAGPIGRTDLLEQYEQPRRLEASSALRALREVGVGFVLKVYVAAHASTWVNPVFAEPGVYTRKAHLLALIGYATQVFADFAGYSLLALGVARAFAVSLPENFNFPFLSTNPMELWRRWHMSLNRWLFDYVYSFMVTGEGFMNGRLGLGLVIVMIVSGIWHGSTWPYVVWGAMHGLWLFAHYRYDLHYKSLCRKDRTWVARRKSAPYLALGWAATIGFFIIALVPFRASSLGDAATFFRGLVLGGGTETLDAGTMHPALAVLLVVLYHVQAMPFFDNVRARFTAAPAPVRGLVLGLVVVFLMIFAPVGAGTFIYAQF